MGIHCGCFSAEKNNTLFSRLSVSWVYMRIRYCYTLALALFLVGCGGGGGEVSCDPEWNGTVGTCLPDGWKVVDPNVLKERGVPGEVLAAYQAESALSGYYPTVTVTREFLQDTITASEYSDTSIASVEVLPGYKLLDKRPVKIDGEKVAIHVFQAQPDTEEAVYRFYQLSTRVGSVGYTSTVAVPLSISEELEEQIVLILEQVTFKEE